MKTTQKEKFFLPFFTGFYETYHNFDWEEAQFYEDEIEKGSVPKDADWNYFNNHYEFDFWEMYKQYSKEWEKWFIDTYWDIINKDTGINISKYIDLYSPQYYNFDTDRIECEAIVDTEKLLEYIDSEWDSFIEYIKEHNASRDGFNSYMETDINKYKSIIKGDVRWNIITQVIRYYLKEQMEDDFWGDSREFERDIDKWSIFNDNVKHLFY